MRLLDYFVLFLGIVFVIIPQVIAHYILELIDWVKEDSEKEEK